MDRVFDKLSVYKLFLFEKVSRSKSIRSASRDLDIPFSTLSNDLTTLEKIFGTKLLSKNKSNVEVTTEGEKILKFSRAVLSEISRSGLLIPSDSIETLRIATTHGISDAFLPQIIKQFSSFQPKTRILVFNGRENLDYLSQDFDIVIGQKIESRGDLSQTFLKEFSYHLYASDSYLEKNGEPQTKEDLKKHDLLIYSPESSNYISEINKENSLIESDSYRSLVRMLDLGIGIASVNGETLPLFSEKATSLKKVIPSIVCETEKFYFIHRKISDKIHLIEKLKEITKLIFKPGINYEKNQEKNQSV